MKRKYERGERIESIQEFSEQEFIWWMGKVYNRGFAFSWQLMWILNRIKTGDFYKVVPIKEEAQKENDGTDQVHRSICPWKSGPYFSE